MGLILQESHSTHGPFPDQLDLERRDREAGAGGSSSDPCIH